MKEEKEEIGEEESVCPEGICDGSGYVTVGQFDDVREDRCPCNPKTSMEELMDDDSDYQTEELINENEERNN